MSIKEQIFTAINWIFSILVGLVGIVFTMTAPTAGFIYVLTAILISPFFANIARDKLKFTVSLKAKVFILIFGFGTGIYSAITEVNSANTLAQERKQQQSIEAANEAAKVLKDGFNKNKDAISNELNKLFSERNYDSVISKGTPYRQFDAGIKKLVDDSLIESKKIAEQKKINQLLENVKSLIASGKHEDAINVLIQFKDREDVSSVYEDAKSKLENKILADISNNYDIKTRISAYEKLAKYIPKYEAELSSLYLSEAKAIVVDWNENKDRVTTERISDAETYISKIKENEQYFQDGKELRGKIEDIRKQVVNQKLVKKTINDATSLIASENYEAALNTLTPYKDMPEALSVYESAKNSFEKKILEELDSAKNQDINIKISFYEKLAKYIPAYKNKLSSIHFSEAKKALDEWKPNKDPMQTVWGRINDAEKHLSYITEGDKEFAEAKKLKSEAERRKSEIGRLSKIAARDFYVKTLEQEYLKKGMDVYITLHDTDKTTIKFKFVLFSRPLVNNLANNADFVGSLKSTGFKKAIFTDGYNDTWTLDLTK
jgi:hypothetical protein